MNSLIASRNIRVLHNAMKRPFVMDEPVEPLDQRFYLGLARACGYAFFLGMLLLVLPLALVAGGAK